ncbi:MAG TPA: glycosyltransferase, partial [Ilumatobacteraceae bacterium]
AMAAGAPVVAARTGGLAEIVAGTDAGLLFEPGNVEQLAERIAQILTSPATAAAVSEAASQLLRDRYSWDAIAISTLQAYGVALTVV